MKKILKEILEFCGTSIVMVTFFFLACLITLVLFLYEAFKWIFGTKPV
jgi:hypothetical protein